MRVTCILERTWPFMNRKYLAEPACRESLPSERAAGSGTSGQSKRRERVIGSALRGLSARQAAARYGAGVTTAIARVRRARQTDETAARQGKSKSSILMQSRFRADRGALPHQPHRDAGLSRTGAQRIGRQRTALAVRQGAGDHGQKEPPLDQRPQAQGGGTGGPRWRPTRSR
jgi:hypothetical protein